MVQKLFGHDCKSRHKRNFTSEKVDDLSTLVYSLMAHTSQELNISRIIDAMHLTRDTARSYISLLNTVYVINELKPWSRNLSARSVRKPKVYSTDSAMAAAILGVNADALARPIAPALGSLLETFVVGEIRKQLSWSDQVISPYHFRDTTGIEVDIVLEKADGFCVCDRSQSC